MSSIDKPGCKLSFFVQAIFFLMLMFVPGSAYAQDPWPPFDFDLTPAYENGKITYSLVIRPRDEATISDLTIKTPLPAGTRYVEAVMPPLSEAKFDGQEIIFFILTLDDPKDISFTVEVTDPALTVFSIRSWISWKGDIVGDYLTEPVSFDITRPTLDWQQPPRSRLQLGISATIADDIITYLFYPRFLDKSREMWDVQVRVPLPEGTSFLAAESPSSFTTNFDGREVSFFTLSLEREVELEPLVVKVSAADVVNPVATHAWASWKNSGYSVGRSVLAEEQLVTGELVVQPHLAQRVIFDSPGDVPLANYDLTSLAFQENGSTLTVTFTAAGEVGPVESRRTYSLFIDADCNGYTGDPKKDRGAEHQISYNHQSGRAAFVSWSDEQKAWVWPQSTRLDSLVDGKKVMISIPRSLIGVDQFCWIGRAINREEAFQANLPADWIPDERHSQLVRHEIKTPLIISPSFSSPSSPPARSVSPAASSVISVTGKLAVPIANRQGGYNVHIFSLPNGQEVASIPNARQPQFHPNGQKLLINRENIEVEIQSRKADQSLSAYVVEYRGPGEYISEFNLVDGAEKQLEHTAQGSHPFYDPSGEHVVYGNSGLMTGPDTVSTSAIFIQCILPPLEQNTAESCRQFSPLVSSDLTENMPTIPGRFPIWASNDAIIYQKCQDLVEANDCGIYSFDLQTVENMQQEILPAQLTQDPTDIPADTRGNLVAFTTRRDGNWEAYLMSLDGSGVRNLSNSSASNDGLPALSPDGRWVAFVSDRSGRWAIWVVPVTGGPAQRMFNLPTGGYWRNSHLTWMQERISWGP